MSADNGIQADLRSRLAQAQGFLSGDWADLGQISGHFILIGCFKKGLRRNERMLVLQWKVIGFARVALT